jgi:VWFA-related protein
VVVLVVLVCASGVLTAQHTTPVFRTATHLIVQTVTVKDKNGKPVQGLTAKDFIVTEDGRPQDIAFVEYQRIDDAPTSSVTVTAGEPAPVTQGTVAIPGDARYRGKRLIILYFDLYNMQFFDKMRMFENAGRYVQTKMTPVDLVALEVFDGLGVRLKQDFTDSRAALTEAIDALMSAAKEEHDSGMIVATDGAFGDDDDTFNIFSTDRQLSALQTAVTDFGPLPELKTLVYFGSGLRLNGTDNVAQMRATVNAAVRANVTLNPIDTRGLIATPPMGDATRPSPGGIGMFNTSIMQTQINRAQQSQDTLYALAKDTGGKATFDNNDLALEIAQAAQAVTGYYVLGYYTPNVATDGKYRQVRVALAPGLAGDLSYRTGYYGEKDYSKFNRADKERALSDALRLEDPITDIPMAAAVNYFQVSRSEYFAPVSVRIPGSELTRSAKAHASSVDIDMIGEIKDEHGVTYRNVRDLVRIPINRTSRSLIQYETGFTMLPGTYVIKLLARNDATGRIGTFETTFTIPNLEREDASQIPISSVVLTSQRVVSGGALFAVKQKIAADIANPLVFQGQKLIPNVGRTFSLSRPLYVFLQAYERDAAAVQPLVAFVTFFRDGAKVFETDPLGVGEWDSKQHALPILFTVPLQSLAPGNYDCRVTVLDPRRKRTTFWRAEIALIR